MSKNATLPRNGSDIPQKQPAASSKPRETSIRNIMQYSAALWSAKTHDGRFVHLLMN